MELHYTGKYHRQISHDYEFIAETAAKLGLQQVRVEQYDADYPTNRREEHIYFNQETGVLMCATHYPERKYFPSYMSAEEVEGQVNVRLTGPDESLRALEPTVEKAFSEMESQKRL